MIRLPLVTVDYGPDLVTSDIKLYKAQVCYSCYKKTLEISAVQWYRTSLDSSKVFGWFKSWFKLVWPVPVRRSLKIILKFRNLYQ